jgi:toxin YoeB
MANRKGDERSGRKDRLCVIDSHCLEDLQWWAETQPPTVAKGLKLMDAVMRDPFTGLGKPEPLKSLGANVWSRRLTSEHRLVYVVFDDRIVFLQARYHY